MKTNTRLVAPIVETHEGGAAERGQPAIEQLRRTLLCCLLWEDNFYEDGQSVADRIGALVPKCGTEDLVTLTIEARTVHGLRHAPLLVLREMARCDAHKGALSRLMAVVIRRADEIPEFLKIYWATQTTKGKKTLSAQVKKGLGFALQKFDEHQISRYARADDSREVRMRDAMFLAHAKPADAKSRWTRVERKTVRQFQLKGLNPKRIETPREELQRKITDSQLAIADTWENRILQGAEHKETFATMMQAGTLGGLAYLRNLRKMVEIGIDFKQISDYGHALAKNGKFWGVLPWQFLTAARAVGTDYHAMLDSIMLFVLETDELRLAGNTAVVIDVSGSMDAPLTTSKPRYRSNHEAVQQPTRMDAACGLAVYLRRVCVNANFYSFSERLMQVPNERGMRFVKAITDSQFHGGTYLAGSLELLSSSRKDLDRIVVVTDEQSADGNTEPPCAKAYIMNVGPYQNGLTLSGGWSRISGWSPQLVKFIHAYEKDAYER